MADPQDIKSLCENEWEHWKHDCSGFLKAVAGDLGITLTGQANAIIDVMGRAPWLQLNTDADKTVSYAKPGYFVVAGLKEARHGHVVIIVPGSSKPYPTGYRGALELLDGRTQQSTGPGTRSICRTSTILQFSHDRPT